MMDSMEKEIGRKEERNVVMERARPVLQLVKDGRLPATIGGLLVSLSLVACQMKGEVQKPIAESTSSVPTATATETIKGKPTWEATVTEVPTEKPTEMPTVTAKTQEATATATVIPQATETAIPQVSRFAEIRAIVDTSQATEEQKQEAFQIIDKLENVDQVLQEFKTAYESYQESDGTPTLLALEKAKYYNLDLKPLWENQFASEREYLESQIYFLNDKTLLDTYFSQLATLDWTDFNSAVEQTRKIDSYYFSPDSIVGRRRTAYLELGERKGQGETEIAVDFEPSNPEEAAKLQELRSEIEEVLDRFQIRNVIDLEIVIGRSGRPEFDRINSKESSILRLYLDSTGPNTIGHELFGHVFDADEDHPHANPLLPRYLSAAELVAIKIESQRALLDGEWGRTYLFVEKMFGPNMTTFAEKTTPEKGELKPDAKLTPEEFAIFATPRDKWPQSALLPFDQFLDRAKIESIVQESPDEPVYYLADFLDSQSASLDQLAANDEIYSYVIEKLREKRKIFSRSPFAILATSTQGWLERLPNLAGLVLAQGFFENDPRAISLFPPEQIGTIESGLVGKTKLADEEFLANARANTIVYGQTNLVQPQENPFKKDVELLLEALKS